MVDNDPRPVLRQELARVFKNQRVIRAFEKIFDLIPPEFINQQTQIDALDLIAQVASAQSIAAIDAINQLTSAIQQLAMAPRAQVISDLINTTTTYPTIDVTMTAAWTGVHTFGAGANVTGTLAVTGNITATTTIAATGAISGSNLSAAGGANPTGTITLTATNGVATTYLRSDGAPALSQSIAPTWTALHTFQGADQVVAFRSGNAGTRMYVSWGRTALDMLIGVSGGANQIVPGDAAGETSAQWSAFNMSTDGGATRNMRLSTTAFSFGDATNNPTFTFLGTRTPTHGGTQLIQGSAGFTNNAAAAAGTLLNAPVAGNPTKWIPINDNGTIRNIPAW
jgi:hypothetical protein